MGGILRGGYRSAYFPRLYEAPYTKKLKLFELIKSKLNSKYKFFEKN